MSYALHNSDNPLKFASLANIIYIYNLAVYLQNVLTMADYLMQLAIRKIKVCFPILNIFYWNKQLNNPTSTQF